jgi:hypothetical protein
MKLSKQKLKQIVKEELSKILAEKKEHPDETCEQAHPDETHEEWEEEPKALKLTTPKIDPLSTSPKSLRFRAGRLYRWEKM